MRQAISRRWQAAQVAGALLLLALGVTPARILSPEFAAAAAPSDQTTIYLPQVAQNYGPRYAGVFIPLFDSQAWNGQADAFVALTGKAHAVYLVSSGFDCPWASGVASIISALTHIHELGATPLITWVPMDCQKGGFGDINHLALPNILDGEWDTYIKTWATDVGNLGYPVFVRWGHEMNIPSYQPWAGQYAFGADGKTFYQDAANQGCGLKGCFGDPNAYDGPERYIAAYRHVHDLAAPLAPNIVWVWNPYERNWPLAQDAPWNQYNNYYPGDAYVDWIALDGYNWGDQSGNGDGRWLSFTQMFGAQLNDLARLHPTKPQMIPEIASVEDPADPNRKAAWIRDAYKSALNYPLLRELTWVQDNTFVDAFHYDVFHNQVPVPVDFRVNSSAASLQAYSDAVAGWLSQGPLN